MRAPRDLVRRRTHLMRTRAALLAPVPPTTSPYNLPERGQKIADQAPREGVADRCAPPAVHQSVEVDWALIPSDDQRLGPRALSMVQAANHPEANPRYLVHTVPGLGQSLSLGRRDDIHDRARCPRGPALVS
jgi:hypothetical protein